MRARVICSGFRHVSVTGSEHKKTLPVTVILKASRGIDDAPRQEVAISMQALLEWGPDWILRPRFHTPPTWFLDHFEMTIANINATSVVETKFQKQMQDSPRAAPKTLAPRAKENGSRIVASTA